MATRHAVEVRKMERLYKQLIAFAEGEFDRGKFRSQHRVLDVALDVQDRLNELDAIAFEPIDVLAAERHWPQKG